MVLTLLLGLKPSSDDKFWSVAMTSSGIWLWVSRTVVPWSKHSDIITVVPSWVPPTLVFQSCWISDLHGLVKLVRLCGAVNNTNGFIKVSINRGLFWTSYFEIMYFRNIGLMFKVGNVISCCWCVLSYTLMFWVILWDAVLFSIYMNVYLKTYLGMFSIASKRVLVESTNSKEQKTKYEVWYVKNIIWKYKGWWK